MKKIVNIFLITFLNQKKLAIASFLALFFLLFLQSIYISPLFAATDNWSTSLHDPERTAASNDTTISTTNAAQLEKLWEVKTGGPIAASPSIVNGVVYVGSWDGYEYAIDAVTGNVKWKTYLGVSTYNDSCFPKTLGISSAATVLNGVVYVGGGDSYWYALNASTGAVLWKVFTGDATAESGHYNWSSPLIHNNYAYIGIASLGDCPLVQGKLLKVNLTTHAIEKTLNLVPDGEIGGGIWNSPSMDTTTNTIYAATGTENKPSQIYAQALIAVDAITMTVKDYWKLPESEAVLDSDFGTSAIVFNDQNGRKLVAAIDKNGYLYAFDRNNLHAGPVWEQLIAVGGECPTCGESSVSAGTLGNGSLYFAGASTSINGQGYPGSVRAIDPATGSVKWEHGTTGMVIGALAYANNVVYSGSGSVLEALDSSTGKRLYSYETGSIIYAAPSVANGTIFTGNVAGSIYAFAKPATPTPTPPADPNCITGWTCQNIGTPTPSGSETVTNGTWTIKSAGVGTSATQDSFRYAWTSVDGDSQISTKVTQQQGGSKPQSGVMFRQNANVSSPFYAAFISGNSVSVSYRTAFGKNTVTQNTVTINGLPLYVGIQRIGDHYQAATSTDGQTFTLIPGTNVTMVMPTKSMAGLTVASGTAGTTSTSVFSLVKTGIPTTFNQKASATACLTGWTCFAVGNPAMIGEQSSNGTTWTIKGNGNDLGSAADQIHYIYKSLAGDSTLSTRITSQSNSNGNAKVGVMMRGGTESDAAYYAAFVTPNNGISIQFREVKGLVTSDTSFAIPGTAPTYLRIARSGNSFTTYTSQDGSTWQPVMRSTITMNTMPTTILAGIGISSNTTTSLSTATIDTVSLINSAPPPPNLCPSSWTCLDIGYPTPSGDQTLQGEQWTMHAGGGDIWDVYDTFRYVYQPVIGDGFISANITSQSNTSEWAKGGLMMRTSKDPAAAYYAVFATPGHGLIIQYRSQQAGNTQQLTTTASPTGYIRIGRVGTTFTTYTSTNGTTWTALPNSTITLPGISGEIEFGMAATSHDTANLSAITYTDVKITQGSLPSEWNNSDIGSPLTSGTAGYSNGIFTVKGAGTDIWADADQEHYVYQPLIGDGVIVARITSQTNTDGWAKAGVMIKESTNTHSNYALLGATPSNGYVMQYNYDGNTNGTPYTFPNAWVKLQRTGNTITGFTSPDGLNWTQVKNITTTMSANATIGLFVNSHKWDALGTVTFDNVSVTSGSVTPSPTPTTPITPTPTGATGNVPAPWANTDIGSPLTAGSTTFANTIFTVKGAGTDIWADADQEQYVYQPLTGDGDITVRVSSQTASEGWAKAGIMMKESTATHSKYVLLAITPGNGISFQWNYTGDIHGSTFALPNAWLKLQRVGDTFTAYSSNDGTNWTQIGTTTLTFASNATVGLFVNSHKWDEIETATFENVTVNP